MQTEKKKLKTLNIFMRDCSCDRCGPGSEEVIEKIYEDFDPIKKEPIYKYYKYEWWTPYDDDAVKNSENVAKTLEGTIVVNDGDEEETTREEYEAYSSYWHNEISKDYILHIEHERELRRELAHE